MLEKFDVDREIKTDLEFRQALRLCCQAKNSLARSKGYTPEILVLGKSRKMPGSLCEGHADPAQYLADSESPEGIAFRQHLEYRELARKAFVQTDNSDRLRRAFLRRQRPHRGHFASGAFVMFWRPGRGEIKGKWHGPARIIIQESENVIWISFSILCIGLHLNMFGSFPKGKPINTVQPWKPPRCYLLPKNWEKEFSNMKI